MIRSQVMLMGKMLMREYFIFGLNLKKSVFDQLLTFDSALDRYLRFYGNF